MSSNNTLNRIVNGNKVSYVPKSLDKIELFIGTRVIVPEPNETDVWNHGNFSATVEDCDERTGDILVIDADGDYWAVEPDRLLVNGDLSDDKISALEKDRDENKDADADLEREQEEAQQLKDEKNVLYADKVDVAN